MRSLSSLGSKNLAHRRGRTFLTGLGIALGVGLLFGVLVANTSVNNAFDHFAERQSQLERFNANAVRHDGAPMTLDEANQIGSLPHVVNANLVADDHVLLIEVDGIDPAEWDVSVARPVFDQTYSFNADVFAPHSSSDDDDGFADFRATIEGSLTAFSAVALFVGGFLIYLTFSTAVLERTALYGLLRALGAHQSQVRRAVLAESLVLGVIASIGGLFLGFGIASIATRLLAQAIGIATPRTQVRPLQVVIALTVGVITAVVSALIPARRAARIEPVLAMRGDHRAGQRGSRWWIAGGVALALGVAIGLRFPQLEIVPLTATLIVFGSVLLVPPLLKPVARALGAVTTRLTRGGRIPVMHLVKEQSRSAYTLGLIMVVLAMAYSLQATSASMHESVDEIFSKQYDADYVAVRSGSPYAPSELAAIAQLPHVRNVTALGFGPTAFAGRRTNAVVIDPLSYFSMLSFAWRDGDDASARAALQRGGAVLLPADLADRGGVHRGDSISLPGMFGSQRFVIAGTFVRFGFLPDMGVVVGGIDGGTFGVNGPTALRLKVVDGATREQLINEVLTLPAPDMSFTSFQSVQRIKASVIEDVDRYFRLFLSVVLVALIVGLLGLANTLGMSIFERTREVGVLRATGMHRSQIGRMVVVESVTLALAAFVLSIPLGMVQAQLLTRGTREQLGFGGNGSQPILWLIPVGIIATLVAAGAALLPARRAARVEIVDALRFE